MIWGLTLMANDGQPAYESANGGMSDEAGAGSVISDPHYYAADEIDHLIQSGQWVAGQLNGLRVRPDKSRWPEKWLALKTD